MMLQVVGYVHRYLDKLFVGKLEAGTQPLMELWEVLPCTSRLCSVELPLLY